MTSDDNISALSGVKRQLRTLNMSISNSRPNILVLFDNTVPNYDVEIGGTLNHQEDMLFEFRTAFIHRLSGTTQRDSLARVREKDAFSLS